MFTWLKNIIARPTGPVAITTEYLTASDQRRILRGFFADVAVPFERRRVANEGRLLAYWREHNVRNLPHNIGDRWNCISRARRAAGFWYPPDDLEVAEMAHYLCRVRRKAGERPHDLCCLISSRGLILADPLVAIFYKPPEGWKGLKAW